MTNHGKEHLALFAAPNFIPGSPIAKDCDNILIMFLWRLSEKYYVKKF